MVDDKDVARCTGMAQAIHRLSMTKELHGEEAARYAAHGAVAGIYIWLKTTFGPREAAELLYRFADVAAAEVPSPAMDRVNQQRKATR